MILTLARSLNGTRQSLYINLYAGSLWLARAIVCVGMHFALMREMLKFIDFKVTCSGASSVDDLALARGARF